MALPGEIWTQIFELATDEDVLFQPGIQTSIAESAWERDSAKAQVGFPNPWNLRSPEQAMDILLKRSYATKKVNVIRLTKLKKSLLLFIRQLYPLVDTGNSWAPNPSFGVCILNIPPKPSRFVQSWMLRLYFPLLQHRRMDGGREEYTLALALVQ